ncbi:MAG: hypothetical protein JRG94_19240, partial [Deltaproteobacteria bacterium]|nr:hypothetical protein [Deltaproteobacteria bacterium]
MTSLLIRASGLALLVFLSSVHVAAAALPTPDVPDSAFAQSVSDKDGPRVATRLLIESNGAATDEPIRVGLLFDIEPGWHIYWRNPGDSGLPTRIAWQVEEATVGELQWPAPEVFHEPLTGFTTYGYAEQVLLSTQITIHSRVDGPIRLGASARFLACKEICIPGSVDLERVLTLGSRQAPDPAASKLFEAYQARVPRPIEEQELAVSTLLSQSAVRPGDSFLYGIGVRTCETPRDCDPDALLARDPAEIFLPYSQTNPALRPLGVQIFPDAAGGFLLALRGHTDLDAPPRNEEPLRGILTLPGKGYFEVALSLPTAEPEDEVELGTPAGLFDRAGVRPRTRPARWIDPQLDALRAADPGHQDRLPLRTRASPAQAHRRPRTRLRCGNPGLDGHPDDRGARPAAGWSRRRLGFSVPGACLSGRDLDSGRVVCLQPLRPVRDQHRHVASGPARAAEQWHPAQLLRRIS